MKLLPLLDHRIWILGTLCLCALCVCVSILKYHFHRNVRQNGKNNSWIAKKNVERASERANERFKWLKWTDILLKQMKMALAVRRVREQEQALMCFVDRMWKRWKLARKTGGVAREVKTNIEDIKILSLQPNIPFRYLTWWSYIMRYYVSSKPFSSLNFQCTIK